METLPDWFNDRDGENGPPGSMTSRCSEFAWSNDDRLIAIIMDGIVRVGDSRTRELKTELDFFIDRSGRNSSRPSSPIFSPDDKELAFVHGRTIYIVSTLTWQLVKSLQAVIEPPDDLEKLISQDFARQIEAAKTGFARHPIRTELEEQILLRIGLGPISWMENSRSLFVSCLRGWATVDAETGRIDSSFYFGLESSASSRISPDKSQIAVVRTNSNSGKSLLIQETDSKDFCFERQLPSIHPGFWTPDSKNFVCTHWQRGVSALNLSDMTLRPVCTHADSFTPLIACSSDGEYLAIHSPEEGIEIRTMGSGELICQYRPTANVPFLSLIHI